MFWLNTLRGLYAETPCKWGFKHDFILTHFLELFPRGRVPNLGMGEGRNTIFPLTICVHEGEPRIAFLVSPKHGLVPCS